jgi:hypothetical protein
LVHIGVLFSKWAGANVHYIGGKWALPKYVGLSKFKNMEKTKATLTKEKS